jgi:hypothetical protein
MEGILMTLIVGAIGGLIYAFIESDHNPFN